MQKIRRNITNYTTFRNKFDRYFERKKSQSDEDQIFEAGVLASELNGVDTDKAYSIVRGKIGKHSTIQLIWSGFGKAAAILILPLLIYTVWEWVANVGYQDAGLLSYQEISNPAGIRSKVILPDGTKVWLNAESTIRYSIPFIRETREVELVGEAFLDVAKNPGSPLEVKFDGGSVRALGTQFNVKAFPDESRYGVILKEGSIQLENTIGGANAGTYLLKPNEQWVLDKTTQTAMLKTVDAGKLVAWHTNMLILDKTPMAEVARQLERWYGVKVEILDKSLYNYKFTTIFENEPLHRVIELLEMSSPIKIRYLSGKPIVHTGETEKAVIQISAK